MKKILFTGFLMSCLFTFNAEATPSANLNNDKKEIGISNDEVSESNLKANAAKLIELSGTYKCSNEDVIRLNSDGTGKMMMSYSFEGVRSFTWTYDSEDKKLSINSEGRGYEMPPLYLTLYLRMTNGRVAFEHYTGGPTFLYIKQ